MPQRGQLADLQPNMLTVHGARGTGPSSPHIVPRKMRIPQLIRVNHTVIASNGHVYSPAAGAGGTARGRVRPSAGRVRASSGGAVRPIVVVIRRKRLMRVTAAGPARIHACGGRCALSDKPGQRRTNAVLRPAPQLLDVKQAHRPAHHRPKAGDNRRRFRPRPKPVLRLTTLSPDAGASGEGQPALAQSALKSRAPSHSARPSVSLSLSCGNRALSTFARACHHTGAPPHVRPLSRCAVHVRTSARTATPAERGFCTPAARPGWPTMKARAHLLLEGKDGVPCILAAGTGSIRQTAT
jgi:hypothetical protein